MSSIDAIRGGEIKVLRWIAKLWALANFTFSSVPFLMTLATFLTFIYRWHPITDFPGCIEKATATPQVIYCLKPNFLTATRKRTSWQQTWSSPPSPSSTSSELPSPSFLLHWWTQSSSLSGCLSIVWASITYFPPSVKRIKDFLNAEELEQFAKDLKVECDKIQTGFQC